MKKALENLSPFKQGRMSIDTVKNPIKLSSNESPYPPSPKAIQAYQQAVSTLNRYPDGGQYVLRSAIHKIHNIPMDNIIASNGSDESISLVMRAFLEDGDHVVTSQHGFIMTDTHAISCGATVLKAPETDYKVHVDSILNTITDKTKIVTICNPNNPTGTYIPISEIIRLESLLPKHILLLLDEAYAEYVDKPDFNSGLSMFSPGGRVVVTRTFSKAYALPALRIGWMAVPDKVADAVHRIRTAFNANTVAMLTAAVALQDTQYTAENIAKNNAVRQAFCKNLETLLGIYIVPSVTNFVLLKFPDGDKNGTGANTYLLQQGIIARPTSVSDRYLRISIGTADEMQFVYRVLKEYMQ